MIFAFGQLEKDRIEVDVLNYERQPIGDYWDDNWLNVNITIQAGGFSGNAEANIITSELERFLAELKPLYETLSGTAVFKTLEEQLDLQLIGDGKGHIELNGIVADQAGIGNRLHFTLHFDQTQLRVSICELEKVLKQFPVRITADKSKN